MVTVDQVLLDPRVAESQQPDLTLDEPPPAVTPAPYRFSVEDFYRMGEEGILNHDERLELLNGEIFMMPPIDPGHADRTDYCQRRLMRILGDKWLVRCQHPVRLGPEAEPIPDIAVVKPDDYSRRHPAPAEVALIVEVANSSLAFDLRTKRRLYAVAAIPEYWVMDLSARRLHVFSDPREGEYHSQRILERGDAVRSNILDDKAIDVSELLP